MTEKQDLELQETARFHRRHNYLCIAALQIFALVGTALWFARPTADLLIKLQTTPNDNAHYELAKNVLLQALQTNYAGNWSKEYSEELQLGGTNLGMVNYTLHQFEKLGLQDTYIDSYTSYMSYPLENGLNLLKNGTVVFTPKLVEDILDEDPTSKHSVPAFLGFAGNGNVTAEYVYCNYGTHDDFKLLAELGVPLEGKIAVIRYGKIFRGLKVKFAQEHGMVGALLYTDVYDDGEVTEKNGYKAYPDGPARNPSAIQRGSSMFLSMTPGDPTTPGYAIKPGEIKKRVSPYDVIPRIPALPISYREVQPILAKLKGKGPKVDSWTGSVDGFDYSIGPSVDHTLNLYSKQEFNVTTINNIMGKIKGKDDSKFILIGNHHDSWTPSAGDPHSGSASMLEIIRAFGELSKTGWVPSVTIVFAGWDAEEYGLIGSTEFAEYYQAKLKKECIAYLNTDVAAVGPILNIQASPLLNDVLLTSAKELIYPNSTKTLYEHFISNKGHIGTLGSGSDYTVFLEHLGIPSVDVGFSTDPKKSPIYQYHSIYDSYHWMKEFGDPDFVFHNALSKYLSLVILHLVDEPILKLRTHDYATALSSYFHNLEIPSQWSIKKCHNPVKKLIKHIEDKLESLELNTLENDANLEKYSQMHENWDNLSYYQRIKLHFKTKAANTVLTYFERHLLDDEGLKGRKWFKHFAYASGRYTGYQGQELPGLAEAIEDHNQKDFEAKLVVFEKILGNLNNMRIR